MQSTSSPAGVTITMDRHVYTVSESSSKVEVCATMTGQSAINNTVFISTATGSAGIHQSSLINIHFRGISRVVVVLGILLSSAMGSYLLVNCHRLPIRLY